MAEGFVHHKQMQKPIECPKCGAPLVISRSFNEVDIGLYELEVSLRCDNCYICVCESAVDFRRSMLEFADKKFDKLIEKGLKTIENREHWHDVDLKIDKNSH